jgi:2,4-dienoyl-CoA reductase-like NADH-dependent reductase (Old Yellow Enzyme family)
MIDASLRFPCGKTMKNRFMLAPLTNQQSNADGSLSQDEFKWLTKRAAGGFGLVMTCAAHVQKVGQGFPGQLGIFDDELAEGHIRLTKAIKHHGSLAVIQLHHAGMRSPEALIGEQPVCASANEKMRARGLETSEVIVLKNDFINAAVRAKKWGYDGIEVHGAHGYILTQFLSAEINHRTDQYGGSLSNRARLLFEIIEGIRVACGADFILGIRLSPERFGMDIQEAKTICNQLIYEAKIDFLDLSLWDINKLPEDERYQNKNVLEHVLSIDRKNIPLTVAGNIRTGQDVNNVIAKGVDFVTIGRAAILHHDFPKKVMENPHFKPIETPVSQEYLQQEGLGKAFVNYMKKWPDFVAE